MHFLEQLAAEVDALEAQLGRHMVLIAESDLNDPRVVLPPEAGGYGIDAQWSDDFRHSLHTVLTGEQAGFHQDFGSFADLAKALTRVFVYDGRYSSYRKRRHGRPVLGLSGHRFLGYLQNHDQIGNRAKGERSSHLMNTGRLKAGAALVLTAPFVPMLFQGEEWGASTPFQYFTDHEDQALGRAVSEGRRREFSAFGWDPDEVPDPQSIDTFQRSKLDWSDLDREPQRGLLDWHRQLIRLRYQMPELSDGRLDRVHVRFDERERWIVVERGLASVACNLDGEARWIAIAGEVQLASDPAIRSIGGQVHLPPDSVAVVIDNAGR
jgi:maltooligosyltrehalose trehalohydrolase